MTNKDYLQDNMLSDVRFAERDTIMTGRYVPYDFAIMYPSGIMP